MSKHLTVCLAAGLLALSGASSRGAEITSSPSGSDPARTYIYIDGDIVAADVPTFRREALKSSNAVVILGSEGGQTAAALEIGKIIRLQGYDTLVTNLSACNSACALIWLSGNTRYLTKSARVGFHATYLDTGGAKRESGVGNAVVGGYLASLNLSDKFIVFATSAPPERLNWLSNDNSARVGINVTELPDLKEEKTKSTGSDDEGTDAKKYGEVGWWSVYIDDSLNNGCFAAASYSGDVILRVGLDARDPIDGYVMLLGSNWKSIEPDAEYEISLTFQNAKLWRRTFKGTNLGTLKGVIAKFDETDLFERLQQEPNVSIYYRGNLVSKLNLKDSKAAIDMMWNCQRAQQRKLDPFAK